MVSSPDFIISGLLSYFVFKHPKLYGQISLHLWQAILQVGKPPAEMQAVGLMIWVVSTAFVNEYIEKIEATSIDDDTTKLKIKILTGSNADKWLKKFLSVIKFVRVTRLNRASPYELLSSKEISGLQAVIKSR